MSSKPLVLHSAPQMAENWAKCCQILWHIGRAPGTLRRESRVPRRGPSTVSKFVILICLIGMPCAAFARTDQTSWENLSALTAGHKVQVLELNSKKVSGTFISFSGTNLSLQEQSGAQIILRQDVRSVTLMENHHRLRNTVIGLAVGAGVGAVIGAATYHSCAASQTFCIDPVGRGGQAGIGAVIGVVGGAIVGALWPSHNTIFRAAAL